MACLAWLSEPCLSVVRLVGSSHNNNSHNSRAPRLPFYMLALEVWLLLSQVRQANQGRDSQMDLDIFAMARGKPKASQ